MGNKSMPTGVRDSPNEPQRKPIPSSYLWVIFALLSLAAFALVRGEPAFAAAALIGSAGTVIVAILRVASGQEPNEVPTPAAPTPQVTATEPPVADPPASQEHQCRCEDN
jgi:hypothetical protein